MPLGKEFWGEDLFAAPKPRPGQRLRDHFWSNDDLKPEWIHLKKGEKPEWIHLKKGESTLLTVWVDPTTKEPLIIDKKEFFRRPQGEKQEFNRRYILGATYTYDRPFDDARVGFFGLTKHGHKELATIHGGWPLSGGDVKVEKTLQQRFPVMKCYPSPTRMLDHPSAADLAYRLDEIAERVKAGWYGQLIWP